MELPDGYEYDRGFIRQVSHQDFVYDKDYKARQSTNEVMSYFRLGWLAAHVPYDEWRCMKLVDIGCGSGEFLFHAGHKFAVAAGYDLCGPSITKKELMETEWDIVVLSDVLEHFHNIDELFDMKWRYALISFPETPVFKTFEEMKKWRHFKPDEHLWYLTSEGLRLWLEKEHSDTVVVSSANFEDAIRTRWDPEKPNISTVLLKREQDVEVNSNVQRRG